MMTILPPKYHSKILTDLTQTTFSLVRFLKLVPLNPKLAFTQILPLKFLNEYLQYKTLSSKNKQSDCYNNINSEYSPTMGIFIYIELLENFVTCSRVVSSGGSGVAIQSVVLY